MEFQRWDDVTSMARCFHSAGMQKILKNIANIFFWICKTRWHLEVNDLDTPSYIIPFIVLYFIIIHASHISYNHIIVCYWFSILWYCIMIIIIHVPTISHICQYAPHRPTVVWITQLTFSLQNKSLPQIVLTDVLLFWDKFIKYYLGTLSKTTLRIFSVEGVHMRAHQKKTSYL